MGKLFSCLCSLSTSDTISLLGIFIPIIVGGIFFRQKNKILTKFQKDIDSNKEKLVQTTNELQEKLRVEYGSLYQKRVEAIEKIYNLIYVLQRMIAGYPSGGHASDEDEVNDNTNYTNDLLTVVKKTRNSIGLSIIYFSDADSVKLMKLHDVLSIFIKKYNEFINTDDREFGDYTDHGDFLAENKKLFEENDFQGLLKNILVIFRDLIGVNIKESTK